MVITHTEKECREELFANGIEGGAKAWQVIEYFHQWDGGEGMKPYGIVAATKPNNFHRFVTWRVYRDNDGSWHAEAGDYCMNLTELAFSWNRRTGAN